MYAKYRVHCIPKYQFKTKHVITRCGRVCKISCILYSGYWAHGSPLFIHCRYRSITGNYINHTNLLQITVYISGCIFIECTVRPPIKSLEFFSKACFYPTPTKYLTIHPARVTEALCVSHKYDKRLTEIPLVNPRKSITTLLWNLINFTEANKPENTCMKNLPICWDSFIKIHEGSLWQPRISIPLYTNPARH